MSLETELFKLINKREYFAVSTLLANNKGIDINALDEEGCSLFMAVVENWLKKSSECDVFIEQVLLHPDFQHANKPVDGFDASPFNMAIGKMDPRLIDLILKHQDAKGIEVVFDKDKLFYEQLVRKIQLTKELLKSNPAASFPGYLDEKQQILSSLLLTTVHHALKTDDPSILQRLADAGAKLHHPLKDGTYAMDLVCNQEGLKVHQWLAQYIKAQISSSPVLFFAASNLARKHEEQAQAIAEKMTQATRESIMKQFKFHDYKGDESSASPESQPKP